MRPAVAVLDPSTVDTAAPFENLLPFPTRPVAELQAAFLVETLLLDAVAHHLLDDARAAESDLERALELADQTGVVWPFLVTTARALLERVRSTQTPPREEIPLLDTISDGELRVLRYLPTHLSAPEIGVELCLSVNTVKTHMARIYQKLGVHRRAEAVLRGRHLGLIGPHGLRS